MLNQVWNRLLATPLAGVLLVIALAVIAAQLSTMVLVVQGQVERAHLRASLQSHAVTAMRNCMQASRGAGIGACRSTVVVTTDP